MTRLILVILVALSVGCASDGGSDKTEQTPEESVSNASGAADSVSTDKEVKVVTAASQEGDASAASADIRNQEETQSTTSGHIQTLGFAGIGGHIGAMIKEDPVLGTITREVDKILAAETLTPENEARLDKLRTDMVARSEALMQSMSAVTPSFDGLKTIVAIFNMENATGHEKTPLTDVAAGHKKDAFVAAIEGLKKVAEGDPEPE